MGVLERSSGFARLVYYVTDAPTAKESIQYIRILALQACHPSGVLPVLIDPPDSDSVRAHPQTYMRLS